MPISIKIATTPAEVETCMSLRYAVFVTEQGVSEADEIDGEDPHCTHVLASLDGTPMGAARYQYPANYAKIQRVCVTDSARGTGMGQALIRFMIERIKAENRVREIRLGAQTHALGFYEKLGFAPFGPEYDDAGIPHRDMSLHF